MKFSYLAITLAFFCSCSSTIKEEEFKIETIHLSPDNEKKIILSDIVDSIFIIPLETTDRSMISRISKIEYDDSLYFILNSQDHFVYVFNSMGDFVNQITRKGNGPGEIQYPGHFSLDKKNKILWATNNDTFFKYQYDGQYIGRTEYHLAFSDFFISQDEILYFYTGKNNNSHLNDDFLTGNITSITPSGEKKTWFKSDPAMEIKPGEAIASFSTNIPFTEQEDGSITCQYALSDTIYRIKDNEPVPTYAVDFGSKKSPVNLEQIPGEDIRTYLTGHSDIAWYLRNTIETNDWIKFSYTIGLTHAGDCFYNKKNGFLLEGFLTNDLLGGNIWMLGRKGNHFIGCVYANDLGINEKIKSFITPDSYNRLKSITPEDNAVLIEFTLKDNIKLCGKTL